MGKTRENPGDKGETEQYRWAVVILATYASQFCSRMITGVAILFPFRAFRVFRSFFPPGQQVQSTGSTECILIDARGRRAQMREFDTDGAAIMSRRGGRGAWSLWPLGERRTATLSAKALGLRDTAQMTAYAESGQIIGKTRVKVQDGFVLVPDGASAFRYEISADPKAEGQ